MEEELLELSEMADKIHEYFRDNPNVSDKEAIDNCPELRKTLMYNTWGEEEKANIILKMVGERSKE